MVTRKILVPLACAFTLGCGGAEAPVRVVRTPAPAEEPPPPAPVEEIPGFTVPRDQPMLLPFWARMEKLSRVLGVPTSDPVFARLIADRLQLGADDYAAGVAPDPLWSPTKMALWVDGLRDVCAHPNMRARHEWLVADLMRDAWGRDPTVDEVTGMKDDLDTAGLTGAARDEVACKAILSSLEVVAQ